MLIHIARFEFRYVLRNPLLWVTAALTFGLFFLAISLGGFELGSEGGLLENAALATLKNHLVVSILFMFVTTSFVANVIFRDDETGYGPIIRSTQITKFQYLFGRFLGSFAAAALCMLLLPLGIWLGSLMPWANPEILGPNRLADHLYAYFLIALPNLLVHSALFFALATITRSMMATYLGVIGLMLGFFILQEAFDRPQLHTPVAIAEPFAWRALEDATRYWTIAERNVLLPPFTGALLYNRLLWTGIAMLGLGLAHAAYRFSDRGITKRERKKQKLELNEVEAAVSTGATGPLGMTHLPSPRYGHPAIRALLWLRTRFEARQVLLSPAFPILMVWGLATTIFVLLTQRDFDGRPTYPTTLSLIPEIEDAFRVIPLIVAIYYAGELVWRERDRRVHELIDAAPLPNWAYVIPKTVGMLLVLVAMLLVNVLAAVITQLSLDHTALELGKYVLWYVLPVSYDMLLLAALAMFIQALSPHKAVGWGIMVLFLMWQEMNTVVVDNLFNYGGKPQVPLSDLNGAGSFWIGAWTFRLYWGALAVLLLAIAHLLWRRGTEVRLKPRLALARRRLAGRVGWVAGAAVLTFTATGAWAYYNTHVLSPYESRTRRVANEEDAVDFEKRFFRYFGLPQPTIVDVKLDIALYPDERRAVTRGRYLLRNLTAQPITELHVRLFDRELELTSAAIAGARLVLDDPKYDYRIYRLERPVQPGGELVMTFETLRWHRGFRNEWPVTRMVENGTFLTTDEFMPTFGLRNWERLQDPGLREKYGLPGEVRPPRLDDPSATMEPEIGRGWTTADVTLSTSADQTPIAPGRKVSDVTRAGRRTARFILDTPTPNVFSIQSARYAEKHRKHGRVQLSVHYHPAHYWNVDRMLDAMAASLDYYQANFGPYQFDHVRIVEFPGYAYYAQAFAGTIPYSEILSFVSDYRAPETIDHVTYVTAHELAHQYWGHQVMPAGTEGASLITETLSQYAALMVMKKLHGEDEIRRILQYELDRYLSGRARMSLDEPPLVRTGGATHIMHRKGALVMYLLQERMGEEAVNRALRKLLNRYKFKGPPYARSLDFIDAIRAEADTADEQALITDLFERVTIYDLEVIHPSAVRRADGQWDVTVPVGAKKFYGTTAKGQSGETETPLDERIEIGLFTAEPGRDVFDQSHVILMERHPIRSGRQVLKFVTDRKPLYAGVDPYNFHIDRDSADNVSAVQ